ncbi:transposase [Prevotella sp. HUN102]|uniref:transposase n=1 Tax=Prevotella sp. HUN102 TaxID=1392486 RepID=UPI0018CC301F|nr:transposase [Prevotella sp. HUN102]
MSNERRLSQTLDSHSFAFFLHIPCSRSGSFYPVLLDLICSEDGKRARLFNMLYTKGLMIEQTVKILEVIYDHTYSKRQISNLTQSCREDVESRLCRELP